MYQQTKKSGNLGASDDSRAQLVPLKTILWELAVTQGLLHQRDVDDHHLLEDIKKKAKKINTDFNHLSDTTRLDHGLELEFNERIQSLFRIVEYIRQMMKDIDELQLLFKTNKQQLQILPVDFRDSPITMETLETLLNITFNIQTLDMTFHKFANDYPWVNMDRFEEKLVRLIENIDSFHAKAGTIRLYGVYRQMRLMKDVVREFQQDNRHREKKSTGDLRKLLKRGEDLRQDVRLHRKRELQIVSRQRISENPIVHAWIRKQNNYLARVLDRLNHIVPTLQTLAQQQQMRRD